MYALLNIPTHKTCKNCGECCGVIPANDAEIQEIRNYLEKHPDIRALAIEQSGRALSCPFRDEEKRRCVIYPVRPMICRLCGISHGMKCAHGNSMEIDGYQFLTAHSLNEVTLLNITDWRK